MMRKGIMKCEVCKKDQEARFAKWFFDIGVVELQIICRDTHCAKSAGRPFIKTYKLVEISKPDEIKRDLTKPPMEEPVNNQADFFNDIVNIKGFGNKTAEKIIQEGIRTKEQSNTDENREKIKSILTDDQYKKFEKKFFN